MENIQTIEFDITDRSAINLADRPAGDQPPHCRPYWRQPQASLPDGQSRLHQHHPEAAGNMGSRQPCRKQTPATLYWCQRSRLCHSMRRRMSNDSNGASSVVATGTTEIMALRHEVAALRRDNELLTATLRSRNGYIRDKVNHLLDVMGPSRCGLKNWPMTVFRSLTPSASSLIRSAIFLSASRTRTINCSCCMMK